MVYFTFGFNVMSVYMQVRLHVLVLNVAPKFFLVHVPIAMLRDFDLF